LDAILHEIRTDAWAVLKEIVPPPALGYDEAGESDLENIDLMHVIGKTTALGRRAAWLRLLIKTVERVMLRLVRRGYPVGIYVTSEASKFEGVAFRAALSAAPEPHP